VIYSQTGTTCEQDIDFYPYGGVENDYCGGSGVTQNYKFTGKERDSESGLDNFGARYDSSALGRFMTPDWSVKPVTVPYAKFGDPQSLNLYSYVENGPVNRIDPDGHIWNIPGQPGSPGCVNGDTSGCGMGRLGLGEQQYAAMVELTEDAWAAAQAASTAPAQNKQKLEAKTGKTNEPNRHEPTLWQLTDKSKSGGYVVQEITATDKDGNQTAHFWEAWPVDKGSQNTSYIDHKVYDGYDDAFTNPAGTVVKASARYYDGLTLPDSFKEGVKGGVPDSGNLKSTATDPHLSTTNATDPVNRTWTAPQD
jgi:RHS repeat-associated protein